MEKTGMQVKEGLEIARIAFREYRDAIGELRIKAWQEEAGIEREFFSRKKWIDEMDEDRNVYHWVVLTSGQVVASARMSFHEAYEEVPYADYLTEKPLAELGELPVASINRLVVEPAYRGLGLAYELDSRRIEFAREQGVTTITAQPMKERVGALTRLGFEMITRIRPPFQIPGREIFFMIKRIG